MSWISDLFTKPLWGGEDKGSFVNQLLSGDANASPQLQPSRSPLSPIIENIQALGQRFQPRPPSITEILSELGRLQDPNRYAVDPALLERQAMATASAQYDPVIAALKGQASAAQTRANRNSQQLGSMFNSLSQDLANQVAPVQQQYADTQSRAAQQYQDLQNNIGNIYNQSLGDQEAMMKRLNIEAAAPDATKGQFDNKAFQQTQAAQQGQNLQDQLTQQGSGAVTFTRQGSQLAKTEGTNRQADLINTLSDYLQGIDTEIGAQSAAKQQAYQAALLGLQQDSQKSGLDRAQRDFDNYLKTIGVMQSLQKGGQVSSTKSPADVAPRALSLGLDTGSSQAVNNAFMSAISSDPLILSAVDPNSGLNLSKEALANRVVEQGRQRGLNSSQLNALQTIALEYFGRQ